MKTQWRDERILVTGDTGLVGSNLVARLKGMGLDVISCSRHSKSCQCDLRDGALVRKLFNTVAPGAVFHLAAKVGGIYANMHQKADFYLENTLINTNVMREAQEREIPFVFAMGTGCAYPKRLEGQTLNEEDFLDGIPEVTNDAYAYSKRNLLVHLKACHEDSGLEYAYCIPANIYGPHDNFHPTGSHVVPGLIARFAKAKKMGLSEVAVWGNGGAQRDFLFVDDLIDAIVDISDNMTGSGPINVATRESVAISDLAAMIKEIVGCPGEIMMDENYPDGQSIRVFNTAKVAELGWGAKTSLQAGLEKTIDWYIENTK